MKRHCALHRKPSNINRLYQYNSNLIGGFILRGRMALGGACPGTPSSIPIQGGAVLGGILWSQFRNCAKVNPSASSAVNGMRGYPSAEESLTIYGSSKTAEMHAFLVYELICLAKIVSASCLMLHYVESSRLNSIGGLAISAAQAVSLILLILLSVYRPPIKNIGECVNRITGTSSNKGTPWPSMIIFILGMLGGSWGLAKFLGIEVFVKLVHTSWARTFIEGIALVIATRTAGGCTPGYGISV
ncbi:hypothetical protein BJ878DRAFT_466551 [Calycina marina]|uniref:Uncharacterized protein n=1 Tax=Calycina marina TaxID=1763456 RepID=A0A9P7YXB0_9HELO|nr:hypothetical protein BJ878DRAFT_466551 [Calycina marina]